MVFTSLSRNSAARRVEHFVRQREAVLDFNQGSIEGCVDPAPFAKITESVGENSVHGSDAPETAAVEIAYFFSGLELVG